MARPGAASARAYCGESRLGLDRTQPADDRQFAGRARRSCGAARCHCVLISLPLGYLVSKTKRAANVILAFLGVIYSIPSLALFVMMPLILGTKILNPLNIVVALAVYSTALLVRCVVDGLRSVSPSVRQSATAVGYGWLRRLFRVEIPWGCR